MVSLRTTLHLLKWIPVFCAIQVHAATMSIIPSSFLANVTEGVVFSCKPSGHNDVSRLLLLQILKDYNGLPDAPVATYVISESPVVENQEIFQNAMVQGIHDSANPQQSTLSLFLPFPTESAAGVYFCLVQAMDSNGLLQHYRDLAELVSLTNSVPEFYKSVLQELKGDILALSNDLDNVIGMQQLLVTEQVALETQLGVVDNQVNAVSTLINDVNSILSNVTQREQVMRAEANRLRDVTPSTKVYFMAQLSSASAVTVYSEANIIFNTVEQTLYSNYSVTTGIFIAPRDGTYFFRTGVTANTGAHTYASIMVGNDVIGSLYAYDDYSLKQSTASAVVWLAARDVVRVVNKSGTTITILGQEGGGTTSITYFMGILLW